SCARLRTPDPSWSRPALPACSLHRALPGQCGHCAASCQFPLPIYKQSPCSTAVRCIRAVVLDQPHYLPRYFIHRQVPVDRNQASLALVVLGHRFGLKLVSGQALPYDFLAVIIADHQLGTIDIASVGDTARLGVDVVDPSADGTGTASGKTAQELIIVDFNPDHNRQTLP